MKKSDLLVILSIAILGAVVVLSRETILWGIGNYLIIEDDLKPVDVIHVIAGDDYRTDYAIRLYKQGYARQIFFTGGWCQYHGWDHGTHGQEIALSQGVPIEAIAYDDARVTSTYNEVERLNAWIDQETQPVHSVIVVSDPFHMRRAQWTYRKVLGEDIDVLMAPIPFDRTLYQRQWWRDEKSQRFVKDEYTKTLYYVLRYQLSFGLFKEWLAALDRE